LIAAKFELLIFVPKWEQLERYIYIYMLTDIARRRVQRFRRVICADQTRATMKMFEGRKQKIYEGPD
jgi:hypothetical protein